MEFVGEMSAKQAARLASEPMLTRNLAIHSVPFRILVARAINSQFGCLISALRYGEIELIQHG
jgi:hypothetical protein